jgi:signal transduction histidine kinase
MIFDHGDFHGWKIKMAGSRSKGEAVAGKIRGEKSARGDARRWCLNTKGELCVPHRSPFSQVKHLSKLDNASCTATVFGKSQDSLSPGPAKAEVSVVPLAPDAAAGRTLASPRRRRVASLAKRGTTMRLSRIFLVRLPEACQSIARSAAALAFPHAEIVEAPTLAEAAVHAVVPAELLVLAEPDEATVATALQTVDVSGQPRWAVVILGTGWQDRAETIPPEEWTLPGLTRAFRSVVRQEQLLRENLRLKGDLRTVARRIRHDLFTPVGCVTTSAHVLEMLPPDDRTTAATMVDNIKASSLEITQLIERIAFVLRASADAPQPAPVEMGAIVAAAVKQVEPEATKAQATIVSAETWPTVHGVAPWLHVIWWNLLENALKYGGPAAQIRLEWEPVDGGWRFSVIDRGEGVPAGRRAQLFRPFDELHAQPAPGLGLSIVHRLVALQGGVCSYERRADRTSAFSFSLPERPALPRAH